MSNLVGNPEDWFSRDETHILSRHDFNQSTLMKTKCFSTSFHVLISLHVTKAGGKLGCFHYNLLILQAGASFCHK